MRESPQGLEWQAEARAEARLETRKEDVQRAVYRRFGTPMPADLNERLAAIKSEAKVVRWLDASVTAPSLDAFRAAVQSGKRKRPRSSN
jgi:hypothetical protein